MKLNVTKSNNNSVTAPVTGINLQSITPQPKHAAVKAKGAKPAQATPAVKTPAVKAKAAKVPAQVKPEPKKAIKAVLSQAVALIKGKRGLCCRLVEVAKAGAEISIRALQDNKGLAMKTGQFAKLENGVITGEKQALLELGCYVNGRMSGAKVELLTPEQFAKRSAPCIVHWNSDDKGIAGRYIGDPNVKGMVAASVTYGKMTYYWQMECDSNAHNKEERGRILPVKDGAKLSVVS